ncbi:hypothetical protein H8E88_04780 [candidate division KSB1 bacterium]|nr:hypothetical protein [candidate division KSB1 bacterium]
MQKEDLRKTFVPLVANEIKSTKSLVYGACGFIIWFLLYFASTFMDFEPSKYVVACSAILTVFLTTVVYTKSSFFIIKVLNYYEKQYYSKPLKLFYYILLYILIIQSVAIPIPFVLNVFLGQPHTATTIVEEKDYSPAGRSGPERYFIITQGTNYWFYRSNGITVTENEYRKFNIGDEVYISGKKSFLGMNVDHVRK